MLHSAHGLDIVVTPKVSIPRLLFMIDYALNPGSPPENIEGVEASGLWGVVAETLCRHAERALFNGVLHSPITITEYPLDLDVPPRELLAQVEELARSAWR